MTSQHLRIAVDFDSTLADMHGLMLPLLNFKNGTHYTKADMVHWDVLKNDGFADDFYSILDQFNSLHLRRAMPPESPYATASVKWLMKQGHEVVVLTANPHESKKTMEDWLFGHGIDCEVRPLGKVHAAKKLEERFDLYIDDSPHLAEAVLGLPLNDPRHLLLVGQPWNRHLRERILGNPFPTSATYMDDWMDFPRLWPIIARQLERP